MKQISKYYILNKGISKPLIGEIDDKTYILKNKYLDVFSELYVNYLFRVIGVSVPELEYGEFMIDNEVKDFLKAEYLKDAYTLDEIYKNMCSKDQEKTLQYFDIKDFQKIQLVDVLISNIDRSSKNILIKERVIYPIDHSKALNKRLSFTFRIDAEKMFYIFVSNPLGIYIFRNISEYADNYYILISQMKEKFSREVIRNGLILYSKFLNKERRIYVEAALMIRLRQMEKCLNELLCFTKYNYKKICDMLLSLEKSEVVGYDLFKKYLENLQKN